MDCKEEVEKFRKGLTKDMQQLSHDLACKYYREDLWNSHKLCGLINLCTFHFESSASLDSYHRRPKRTMYDFGA